ncbi:hypothetical protein [Listeria grandensis]|uniref:hypothetical protein n=1 Tax=Listeria grandensis TaxID=1494963 RepID=UPI0011EA58DA|nr:hypothetical protein [Listeria grandensis]
MPIEYRKVIYPILSTLSNRNILIILVGDYEILKEDEFTFTQKMIHWRYDLSDKLRGRKVWENFNRDIRKRIGESSESKNEVQTQGKIYKTYDIRGKDWELFNKLEGIFESDETSTRSANEFFDLLDTWYFKWKYNEINFGQFAIVAYIYSFHKNIFEYVCKNKLELCEHSIFHKPDLKVPLKDLKEMHPKLGYLVANDLFYLEKRSNLQEANLGFTIEQGGWMFPQICQSSFFPQYMPFNTDKGLKTDEIEGIFELDKESFLTAVQGEKRFKEYYVIEDISKCSPR